MCLKLASELLDFWIYRLKKNQPKPIIRTGLTVPNVQKCVLVATLTLLVILVAWEWKRTFMWRVNRFTGSPSTIQTPSYKKLIPTITNFEKFFYLEKNFEVENAIWKILRQFCTKKKFLSWKFNTKNFVLWKKNCKSEPDVFLCEYFKSRYATKPWN